MSIIHSKITKSQLAGSFRFKRFPGAGDWHPFNQFLSRSCCQTNANLVHETFYSQHSVAPKMPTVVTVYDMLLRNKLSIHILTNLFCRLRKGDRRADRVICISESTKRELIKFLAIPESKISTIHLGFELSTDASVIANANNKFVNDSKKSTTKPYLLHVGYRAGYKNFTTLLKAYAASDYLKNTFNLVTFG
jgi:glycosyltransferase involved in cell wall biosynthesis